MKKSSRFTGLLLTLFGDDGAPEQSGQAAGSGPARLRCAGTRRFRHICLGIGFVGLMGMLKFRSAGND